MKHIVTIGGGNGQSQLLRGLRGKDVQVTAIVSMFDSGGSSGVMREEHGIMPPGDLRRCIAALSSNDDLLDQWNERDELGHAEGNKVLLPILQSQNLYEELASFEQEYNVLGQVLPVANTLAHISTTLSDGTVLHSEEELDTYPATEGVHISSVALEPSVEVTHQVADAILSADMIVLSMGSPFTSVIPNLLVNGVPEAIAQSNAPVVFICNRTNGTGETIEANGYSAQDYIDQFNRYLGDASIRTVIVDDGSLPIPAGWDEVSTKDIAPEVTVVRANLSDPLLPQAVSAQGAADQLLKLCESF